MDATIGSMLEALQYGGRRVGGFGHLGTPSVSVNSAQVLTSLGADPSTVYDAYQAQAGFAQMANVFGKAEGIASTRDNCLKGCGADQNCMNNCSKTATLALEGLATGIATAFDPVVGLAVGSLFSTLNQVFGFAAGVPDPDCPNGPLPWPPSPSDQQKLATAAANILAGTSGPSGLVPGSGVTDPFLLTVLAFRAQQSALIENCHWDQALSGSGGLAAQALMLEHWNALHAQPTTITRTVCSSCPGNSNPPDFDQWTWFVSEMYFAANPQGADGDQASMTVNVGGLSLSPVTITKESQGAAASSTGAKVALGGAVVAGAGALTLWGYALTHGMTFVQAWNKAKRAVTGGDR